MKTYLITFIEMRTGDEFTQMLSARDDNHVIEKANIIEIQEAAMIQTIEEL